MARQSQSLKWLTPDRKAHLIALFTRSQGFCVFGHKPCRIPEHHYEAFIEDLITDWLADDRARREAEWQAERRELHNLRERREPIRGRFSAIGRDIFFADQPQYYLIGLGINGLTFKPFAKVRLASSFVNLYIDLGDSLKEVSKAQRRKALRYGKVSDNVRQRLNLAVRHYLDH
jgi:hypothetical protein